MERNKATASSSRGIRGAIAAASATITGAPENAPSGCCPCRARAENVTLASPRVAVTRHSRARGASLLSQPLEETHRAIGQHSAARNTRVKYQNKQQNFGLKFPVSTSGTRKPEENPQTQS